MNTNTGMSDIAPGMPENAVSVYGQSENAYEDFPVLKAFQQYIDAEQSKARKRLMLLCAFFGMLMFIVVSVFLWLLISSTTRNQMLNDRILEIVMKEREQRTSSAPVVVQPPQDASVVLALTEKLDELQKKLAESQSAATQAEQRAFEASAKKGPTAEELEIARLKALLTSEREKQAVERERQRQAELEEYRRKHYPELYEKPNPPQEAIPPKSVQREPEKLDEDAHGDLLKEVDQILGEGGAVTYFDDEDESNEKDKPKGQVQPPSPPAESQKEYSIPVDIRGSSSHWNIPND